MILYNSLCSSSYPGFQGGLPGSVVCEVRAAIGVYSPPWTTVIRLLRASLPATVLFRIGAVVLPSSQRTTLGALAHISEKRGEGQPTRVQCDAPSPVREIVGRVGVQAALFHRFPGLVGGRCPNPPVIVPGVSVHRGWSARSRTLNRGHLRTVRRRSGIHTGWHAGSLSQTGNAP